ncbi:ABC transporter substrate-binding protein [Kineococcus sp. TRM81007]|uniref:ABC transporter substrate-binding protein n=1 Tax=Kineococcus sp. TRM81007 TaxID=2925831 RepID=UPI001F5A5B7C|nr:ABC transporter substrate-binding protein [Kineococcus sp. TRM81007]MCI2238273.1 ABC transporter substrate-binding protein [Kineococcus sp. TRM81007]
MTSPGSTVLSGVGVRFGEREVLRGVDLDVGPGELLAVVGPSGAGKSTLLQVLAGLRAPDTGTVRRPDDGPAGPGRTALVAQQAHLLPWRTVAGNVALGLEYRRNGGRWPARSPGAGERVARVLGELGIADLAARRPGQLSGGQAQRVALARAVVTGPSLLLLDEPFGALDPLTRSELQDWLGAVRSRLGTAVVLVTHDLDEALLLGDRVALLSGRPGPLAVVASPVRERGDLADGSARRVLLERFPGGRDVPDPTGGAPAGASAVAAPGQRAAGRRQLLRAGAATALLAAPFAAGLASGAPGRAVAAGTAAVPGGPLRTGYLPITDAAPLLVAHADGELAAQGLTAPRPVMFRSWPDLAEALQAGAVDVVHMLMPLAVQLRHAAGVPVRVLMWNHVNGSALTVAPDVGDVADLAGRTVAVPFWWSVHNVVVQQVLRAAGLRPVLRGEPSAAEGTVKLVLMAPSDMPPALAAGEVAGFTVAEPFNAAAEVQGVGRVLRFTGDVWKDHACCVTVVHQRLLDERPEAADAAVRGLVAAQRSLRADGPRGARLLSEGGYLPQPLPALLRTFAGEPGEEHLRTGAVQHPQWHQQRIGFQPYPHPSYTAELVRAMGTTDVVGDTAWLAGLDPAAVHADLVDDGPVLRALGGTAGLAAFGTSPQRTEVVAP